MLAWLLPKPNKVSANTYRAKKLVSPFIMGVERIHACPNHCILYRGILSKTWTNALYVLQIDTKTILVIMVAIIKVQQTDKRKRQGASVEPPDTTLGISEKQRRILAMVMWYLLVADRLRRFFSNPKDAELMR